MKGFFIKILDSITLTKKLSWILLLVWSLLLFLPELLKIQAPSLRGYIISCAFSILIGFVLLWIISLVGEYICKVHKLFYFVWSLIWTLCIVLYSISELFLISFFNLQWNAFTFQLINETNKEESLGFVETYGNSWLFILLILFGVAILIFCFWSVWYFNIKEVSKSRTLINLRRILSLVCILFICIEGRCFSIDATVNYSRSDKLIRRSGMWSLYQSVLKYNEGKDQLEICAASQKDFRIVSSESLSDNIILIIGETFNRHHSDLYGYPLQTNPLISEKEPIVFTDVITPFNATTLAFRDFLSFEERGGSVRWYETPLFPALFKEVGYNVVFYSNQYVVEGGLDFYDSSAGFFNHPAIYKSLFNVRNHRKYTFDMQMVDDFIANRNVIEKDHKNLIIFHLEGQHSPAVERYPADFAKFTADDYDRPELPKEHKQYIADYDNATLYNDMVVSKIISLFEDKEAIVIYFADHGEEIYDFRDKAGRFSDFEQTGENGLRNQLDIPFLVFASAKFRQEQPDIVSMIEASKDKPFMTDYLPHLLLWLGGIDSEWYDESKNLFSNSYNKKRNRIVANAAINYDSICN